MKLSLVGNGQSTTSILFEGPVERRFMGRIIKPHLGPLAKGKFVLGALMPRVNMISKVQVPTELLPAVVTDVDRRGFELTADLFSGPRQMQEFVIMAHAVTKLGMFVDEITPHTVKVDKVHLGEEEMVTMTKPVKIDLSPVKL